jgi:hypothetical protein
MQNIRMELQAFNFLSVCEERSHSNHSVHSFNFLPIGENNSVNLMPLYYEGNAHRYPNN